MTLHELTWLLMGVALAELVELWFSWRSER
jgi:hypothetical protein